MSIAEAIEYEPRRVWRWLIKFDGELWHVSRWVFSPHGGPYAGYYELGPKPSERFTPPKQKVRPASKNTKAYRKRLKASGEIADVRARERARYWKNKKPKPHPLMAMFGNLQEKTDAAENVAS